VCMCMMEKTTIDPIDNGEHSGEEGMKGR